MGFSRQGWFSVFGLVCMVPVAAADLAMTTNMDPAPIGAGREQTALHLELTDDCQDLLLRSGGSMQVPVTVELANASPFIVIMGPSAAQFLLDDCLMGAQTAATALDWTVALKPEAPGLEPLRADLVGTLNATTGNPERTAEAVLLVVGKADLGLKVEAREKLIVVHGNQGVVNVTVFNRGNVKTSVALSLSEAPSTGTVSFPTNVVLNTVTSGLDSTASFQVVFQAPEGSWSQAVAQILLKPSAAIDPTLEGAPQALNILFHNGNPLERSTPSPAGALTLVGLLAIACARRRP